MSEKPKLSVISNAVDGKQKATRSRKSDKGDNTTPPIDLSFPEGCPVEPLGYNGEDLYFLDQGRQLRIVKSKDLNQGNIRALFIEQQELKYTYWPRYGKPDDAGKFKVVGWRPEQGAECLAKEAGRRGQIDLMDCVRGPGSWCDDDGGIVMHCGNMIYEGKKTPQTPKQIGRHIYPAHPQKPYPNKNADVMPMVEELTSLLKTWNWVRRDMDPQLLIGWIAAAMIGGALDWRPLIWITGDKSTGKSTLHKVIRSVLGHGGFIAAADATAAGLWQQVGHASLPVALDELEAEQDDRKAHNIIKLARIAASGDQVLRGGSDHVGSSFTVRSCFMFSSILIPPMMGQDASRMSVLELNEFAKDAGTLRLEPRRLAEIGDAIRGCLLQDWDRVKHLIDFWKDQMADAGHATRARDLFGTLIACYDALSSSSYDPDPDTIADWMSRLECIKGGGDDVSDTHRCLSHLMSSLVDLYRGGERRTIGNWILQAAGKDRHRASENDRDEANRALMNLGLRICTLKSDPSQVVYLAIHNDHQGLATIFRDTHWKSRPGTNGVWVQAVRRVKGNQKVKQRFGGTAPERCTIIPLSEIWTEEKADSDD